MALTPVVFPNINRLLSHINCIDRAYMNVGPTDLTEEGIIYNPEENAVLPLKGMTGIVNSPNPYWTVRVTVNIIKSSPAVTTWLDAVNTKAVIGKVILYSDSDSMKSIEINNCAIQKIGTVNFNGTTLGVPFEIVGSQIINQNIWDEA